MAFEELDGQQERIEVQLGGIGPDIPSLSVSRRELDALHPTRQSYILGLMTRFAVGQRPDVEDLADLFTVESMTLHFPAQGPEGEVEITTLLGGVMIVGDADAAQQLAS